jgi:hypothetical protein
MGWFDKLVSSAEKAATDLVDKAEALGQSIYDAAQKEVKDRATNAAKDAVGELGATGERVVGAAQQAAAGTDALDPNLVVSQAERAAGSGLASVQARFAAEAAAAKARVEAAVVRSTELAAQQDAAARDTYAQLYGGSYSDPYSEGAERKHTLVNTYSLTRYLHWDPANSDSAKYPEVSVDLPYVQRITMQSPNAVARTRNLSGGIYAEHAGFIQRTFVIEGRSGPVWNVEPAPGDANVLLQQLGISRFTALRNFLEAYGKENAENKNALVRFKDTRLVFTATFESEAQFCDVVNFNYRRSADTSTYSFEYSLTLVTNGFTDRKFSSGSLLKSGSEAIPKWVPVDKFTRAGLLLARDSEYYLGILLQAQLGQYIAAMSQWSRDIQQGPEGNFRAINRLQNLPCSELSDLRVANSVLSAAVDTTVFTYADLVRERVQAKAFLSFTSYGLDIAHSLKGSSGTPCPVPPWSDLYYGIVPYANAGAALIDYIYAQFGDNRGYDYTYSVKNTPPVREGLQPTASTGPERPFAAINYFMPVNGADAYSVAAAALGDINAYWRIIELNNFRDAYTRADGTPLVAGSSVLVPSPRLPVSRENDVLGTDLLLVNGDLQLVGNNDVMRISGYANYTQNLLNRMRTPRGTNRVFPAYGLSSTIHTRSDSTVPSSIRHDVSSQVMQDHRTDDVGSLVLTELGDKVQVSMVVKTITGPKRSFKFNYTINAEVTP